MFIIIFVYTIYWEVTFITCLRYTILPSVSLSRVFRRQYCILKASILSLRWDITYPHWGFPWFSSVFQASVELETWRNQGVFFLFRQSSYLRSCKSLDTQGVQIKYKNYNNYVHCRIEMLVWSQSVVSRIVSLLMKAGYATVQLCEALRYKQVVRRLDFSLILSGLTTFLGFTQILRDMPGYN